MSINVQPAVQTRTLPKRKMLTRYVNVVIDNCDNNPVKIAEFSHTYNGAVLPKASDYMVAVPSFTLPLQNLPLFIMPIQANQANSNLSTMSVGVCHNMAPADIAAGLATPILGEDQTFLLWEPQEMGLGVPSQSRPVQIITDYYFGYSFEHFVNMTNTAMATSFAAAGSPGGAAYVPIFSYDEVSHTFAWTLDTTFIDAPGPIAYGWTVITNKAFDDVMNSFLTIENGDKFLLEDTKSQLTHTDGNIVTLTQDFPSSDYFNSISRVLLLTNNIPIVQDLFPSAVGVFQGLSAKQSVLADVSLDFDNDVGQARSNFVYSPSAWQWSDLQGELPLRTISVRFVWIDSLGNSHQVPVSDGDSLTVKLAFYHKDLLQNSIE